MRGAEAHGYVPPKEQHEDESRNIGSDLRIDKEISEGYVVEEGTPRQDHDDSSPRLEIPTAEGDNPVARMRELLDAPVPESVKKARESIARKALNTRIVEKNVNAETQDISLQNLNQKLPDRNPSKPLRPETFTTDLAEEDIIGDGTPLDAATFTTDLDLQPYEITPGPELPPEELRDEDIITMESADAEQRKVHELGENDIRTMESADRIRRGNMLEREEDKARNEQERIRETIQKMHDTTDRGVDPRITQFDLPTDPSDIYQTLRREYPNVQLNIDGTPVGGFLSKNKKEFNALMQKGYFRELVTKLQKVQKENGVFVAKPKSAVGRFFEKIGLAAGLIGATGAVGTSLENRNSDDTRAAQINSMSNLDTASQISEGQIDFESLPEDIFDLKDPRTTEIIAGVAKTGRIERININNSVNAKVITEQGITYVRLHNKRNGKILDARMNGTTLMPDTTHHIQRVENQLGIEALNPGPTDSIELDISSQRPIETVQTSQQSSTIENGTPLPIGSRYDETKLSKETTTAQRESVRTRQRLNREAQNIFNLKANLDNPPTGK